jgi:hypothetical protein
MNDATRLGAALMERNTISPRVHLFGKVYGKGLREVSEKAVTEAHRFFEGQHFEIELSVEPIKTEGEALLHYEANYTAILT